MKTTEERKFEKIGHLRNELLKKRMLSQQSLLNKKIKPLPMSVCLNCDVTSPKVFSFQIAKRVMGLGQASGGSAVCHFTKTVIWRPVSSQVDCTTLFPFIGVIEHFVDTFVQRAVLSERTAGSSALPGSGQTICL